MSQRWTILPAVQQFITKDLTSVDVTLVVFVHRPVFMDFVLIMHLKTHFSAEKQNDRGCYLRILSTAYIHNDSTHKLVNLMRVTATVKRPGVRLVNNVQTCFSGKETAKRRKEKLTEL